MLRARGAKSLRVLMDCRKVADFNRRDAVNRSSRGLLSQCFGCCQSQAPKPSLGESAAKLRQMGGVETSRLHVEPLPWTGLLAKRKTSSCCRPGSWLYKSYRGWPHPVNLGAAPASPQASASTSKLTPSPQRRQRTPEPTHVALSYVQNTRPASGCARFGPPTRAPKGRTGAPQKADAGPTSI